MKNISPAFQLPEAKNHFAMELRYRWMLPSDTDALCLQQVTAAFTFSSRWLGKDLQNALCFTTILKTVTAGVPGMEFQDTILWIIAPVPLTDTGTVFLFSISPHPENPASVPNMDRSCSEHQGYSECSQLLWLLTSTRWGQPCELLRSLY